MRAGRNVLSAFVPSTAPEAELNGGFLVRHRVFSVGDQDRDGVPDGAEVGAGATLVDSDGDGLLDGVERRIGLASADGIPDTSRTGAITVARVRPAVLRRGRAFAIGGAGLEAIDTPGEVSLGGLLAPLVHLPSALLSLADAGGSSGSLAVSIDMDSAPMLQNLVIVSSIRAQVFFDEAGGLVPSRAHNIPLFVNMLQFGSSTRVLIDATRISPSFQLAVTPDLETVLRTHGGVTNVATRLLGTLSSSVLHDVDLLVVLVTVPVGPYAPSEVAAIADWLRVPGRRLVVVSDSCCGPSPASSPPIANGVLAAVGAASRFDSLFPSAEEQELVPYLTGGVFPNPPFTNGVDLLAYEVPGSILVGAGAIATARVGICLAGETGVTVPGPGPVHPQLVACRVGEGSILPVIEAPYVATETVTPGTASLRIEQIALGASFGGGAMVLPVPPNGFVELPPASQITIEAHYENLAPTSASLVSAGLSGGTLTVPATIDASAKTITRTVGMDPRQEALSLRVIASGPGTQVADSAVVRARRERAKLHTVVFADGAGTPAIAADVLARNRRQAALELANGVLLTGPTGVALPGLDPSFVELGSGGQPVVVQDAAGADLVLEREGAFSTQVEDLVLRGNPPDSDSDPGNRIPSPVMAGPAAVRVFVARTLQRLELEPDGSTSMEMFIPQDAETGISQFGQAFFQVALSFENAGLQSPADAVIVQTSSVDLEAGTLRTARPVASSLAHELVHVLGGVQDSAAEAATIDRPFAFPAPADPSVMNSFPFFRSLRVGSTVLTDCSGQATGDVPDTTELCRRVVSGYACGAGRPAIDFTE